MNSKKGAKTVREKTWLLFLFLYHPPRNPYFLSILPWFATQSVKKPSPVKSSLCATRSHFSKLVLPISLRMSKLILEIFRRERYVSRQSYVNTIVLFQKRRSESYTICIQKNPPSGGFFNGGVFHIQSSRWHYRGPLWPWGGFSHVFHGMILPFP